MARIVLILIVCSVLMFAVVLQTPPEFVKSALAIYGNFQHTTAPAEKEKPDNHREAIARKKLPVKNKAPRSAAIAPTEQVVSESVAPAEKAPVVPQHRPLINVFSVAADGTALYSLNSTKGSIVRVLHKGDVVEPQLEINDAGQTWAFVHVAGENISGFLRRDSLERHQLHETIQ
jgi:hypothetical protein